MKTNLMHRNRESRLLGCFVVFCIVFTLLVLVAVLVAAVDDDEAGHSSGRCAPAVAGTVDPVTCRPYGSSGSAAVPGTKDSRSSVQKPKQNAPAAKAPAAAPRISVGKR